MYNLASSKDTISTQSIHGTPVTFEQSGSEFTLKGGTLGKLESIYIANEGGPQA